MKNKSTAISTMHPIAEADLVRLLIICRRYKWEEALPDLDALPSAKERVETFLNHVMPEITGPGWEEVTHSKLRRQLLAGESNAVYSLLRQAYDWDLSVDEGNLHITFNLKDRVDLLGFDEAAAELAGIDPALDCSSSVFAQTTADYDSGDLAEAPFIRFGARELSSVLIGLAREMQLLLPSWKLNSEDNNLTAALHHIVKRKFLTHQGLFCCDIPIREDISIALNGSAGGTSGERVYSDDALVRLALIFYAPSFADDPVSFINRVLHIRRIKNSDRELSKRTDTCISATRRILLQMVKDGYDETDPDRLPSYLTARRANFDIVDLAVTTGKEICAFRDVFL